MILALLLIWGAGAAAGLLFAQQQDIPVRVALAVLPAYLLEVTFYLVLGIETLRQRLEKLPPVAVAALLTVAAVVPYCAASVAVGTFDWRALGWLAALSAAASFWYLALPHKLPADLLFLAFMSAVWISRFLRQQYVTPAEYPKLQLEALGHLMWVRTGILALLSVRRMRGVGFGFWPGVREWKIGAAYFLGFLPGAAVLAWWIGFAIPRWPATGWERTSILAIGTFFGALWVLALSEEFLFRGLLQQWISTWLGNDWLGLGVASLVFGSVHLWMRPFPNWRNAVMATVLGVFCGLAFRQARSIRASMVTHALTVTTWKMFFA